MTKPTKLPTLADFRQHVIDLAAAFQVKLEMLPELPPDQGFVIAKPGPGVLACYCGLVCVAPVTDDTTYAVALHELGHLIAPNGHIREEARADTPALKLHEEEAAWAWAEYIALDWTVAMEAVKRFALGSYEANLRRSRGAPA